VGDEQKKTQPIDETMTIRWKTRLVGTRKKTNASQSVKKRILTTAPTT